MQASSVWNEELEQKPLSGEIQERIMKGRGGNKRDREREKQTETDRERKRGNGRRVAGKGYSC